MEVVGVAKNARDHRLRGDVPPRYYLPGDQGMQGPNEWAIFDVRTAGDPEQMIASVRKTILSVDENLPVEGARPLVESVDRTNAQPRMVARLCSIFGIMALLLASTGLYGVLSYGVARRTNEIGIRMALGAGRGRVIQMILRETGVMIAIGVVAGDPFHRHCRATLQVQTLWPGRARSRGRAYRRGHPTAVALVAGYIPAARAARVNPTQALRHE